MRIDFCSLFILRIIRRFVSCVCVCFCMLYDVVCLRCSSKTEYIFLYISNVSTASAICLSICPLLLIICSHLFLARIPPHPRQAANNTCNCIVQLSVYLSACLNAPLLDGHEIYILTYLVERYCFKHGRQRLQTLLQSCDKGLSLLNLK